MTIPTAKQIDKRTREWALMCELNMCRQAIRLAPCAACGKPISTLPWLIDDSATGEQALVHEDCEQRF